MTSMLARVYVVTQWFRGSHAGGIGDQTVVIGVCFARDEAEAELAVPAGLIEPYGVGEEQWMAPAFTDVGEIELGVSPPVFMKYD
jgi:hypothetical protein